MSEHGVELVQLLDAGKQSWQSTLEISHSLDPVVLVLHHELFLLLGAVARQKSDIDHEFFTAGEELVQRWVQGTDRDRESVHRLENASKIFALQWQKLLEGSAATLLVVCQNHLAHGTDFSFSEEHVLRAAEPDALGSECTGLVGIAGNISVGADFHFAVRVGPGHELLQFRIVGIRRDGVQLSFDHASSGAVERDPVSFLEDLPLHAHLPCLLVDIDITSACHAALAHAARHYGRMARHAAARSEN